MSLIHQTYATHCTYASSAIERRETVEFRDRVLGYSARASSYSQADLRRHFRTIERFLYYYLPKDTPPDKKQSLTPQAAPRRLFFCPSLSGLQVLGQIAYRPTDCAGRVGSYFGHVLTADVEGPQGAWDVIECLQLWNAPGWVLEDSPGFSYELPVVRSLSVLRGGSERPLDERVLWSFLNTPAGGAFYSPDWSLIPDRWRKMPVADRQRFFRLALSGYLEAASESRESLLLLAEPPMAVLFFYGIARLLPAEVRTQLSFSTFEAASDRLVTALAAQTFDDEQAGGDVPDERYKHGFVVNTWQADRVSPLRYTQGRYAELLVSSLVGRPDADAAALGRSIDHLLVRFQAAGVKQAGELEAVVQAHVAAEQMLGLRPGPADESWRQSPQQSAYVVKAVRQQLRGTPPTAVLDRLLKSPEQLPLIFEAALSGGGDDDCRESLSYLVERIEPIEQLDKLLGSSELARPYKLHALRHYVATHRRLPHPCRWLWTPPHGSPRPPLILELLHFPETTAQVLRDSFDRVPDEVLNLMFRGVLTSGLDPSDKREILIRLAGRTAFNVPSLVGELVAKLAAHADVLRPVLVPHLRKLLEQLPDQPSRFAETMAVIEVARPLWHGDAAAAGIHGWLDLKRKLDGHQQQSGQRSVLGRGAKAPGPWEFEEQAGEPLIPWVSSLGPPQSAAARSQKIAALLCGLGKDAGIGYCLCEESEPYLAAVLRKDEAEKRRIREAVAAARMEKEDRQARRWYSAAKAVVAITTVLLAVLGVFLWREAARRATEPDQSVSAGPKTAAGSKGEPKTPGESKQAARPAGKQETPKESKPAAAPAGKQEPPSKAKPAAASAGEQKTGTESKPATAPAVEPAASEKTEASSPKPGQSPPAATGDRKEDKAPSSDPYVDGFKTKRVPAEAGPMASAGSGTRPEVKSADGKSMPLPPPPGDIGPGPSPPKPQATTPAEAKAAAEKPEAEPAPPALEPPEILPPALVAEAPLNSLWFDPKANPVTELRHAVPGEIDIRLHGAEFFTRIRDAHKNQIRPSRFAVGPSPDARNAKNIIQMQVLYEGVKNPTPIANIIISPKPPQLNCRVFQKEEGAFEGKLQRQALQYSVLELVPTNPEEKHVWLALVKPILSTFTLNEKGESFLPCADYQKAVPGFVDWNRLYLGPGKIVGADGHKYSFGENWDKSVPKYEWTVSDQRREFGLLDLAVRYTPVDDQLKLQLVATVPNELRKAESVRDQLTSEKKRIEARLDEIKKDPPFFDRLGSRDNYKRLVDWCEKTAYLVATLRIEKSEPVPHVPKSDELEGWRSNRPLNEDRIKQFDDELKKYQRWVKKELASAADERIRSFQEQIDGLAAKHGEGWTKAVSQKESLASWLKGGVKIHASLYRLVPYGALGHEGQDGDPEHIRVMVIVPQDETAASAEDSSDKKEPKAAAARQRKTGGNGNSKASSP